MMPHHEKRTFVNKVDYIAGVGYPGGKKAEKKIGIPRGPELVITQNVYLNLIKLKGCIKVKSIHPGLQLMNLEIPQDLN